MMVLFNKLNQLCSRYYIILWLILFTLPIQCLEMLVVTKGNRRLLSGLILLQFAWVIILCKLLRRWIPTLRLRSSPEYEEKASSLYSIVRRIIYYSGLSLAMSMPMSIIFIASRPFLYRGIASIFFLIQYHISAGGLLRLMFSWQLGTPPTIVLTSSRRRIITTGCALIATAFFLTVIFWYIPTIFLHAPMKSLMIGILFLPFLAFIILVVIAPRYFQEIENASPFSSLR